MSGLFSSIKRELNVAGQTISREVDKITGPATRPLENFKTGNVVQLVSRSSGKTLQIVVAPTGQLVVDGCGPEGPQYPHAHWTVTNEGNNVVRLANQNNFLAIANGATSIVQQDSAKAGGVEGRFRLDYIQNFVLLESYTERGRHVGVNKQGQLKSAVATGREFDGQWGVRLIYTPHQQQPAPVYPQAQAQPHQPPQQPPAPHK